MINIAATPAISTPNKASRPRFDNETWRPQNEAPYHQARNRSAIEPAIQILANRAETASGEEEVKLPTWAVGLFGTALTGAVVIVGALIGIIYGSVTDDIKDLKTEVKETKVAIQSLVATVGEIGKQAAVTNARLDATNDKLQTLVDEAKKRR